MDQFLKDEEIIKIISEYIENKNTDYAIMIDGEWGSGKTHFILKKLKVELNNVWKKNKKEIKFIYVSTYGVKDTIELDNKIYEEIIKEFLPEKIKKKYKDIENGLGSLYEIIKEFTKWPNISKNSIRSLIEILQKRNQKNYVLIFDDLERSEMPITELLGYINEFVEHKEMKTVIIANEKEILKKKMYSNCELKYIAAESENLNIPVKKKSYVDIFNSYDKKGDVDNKNIDIESLNSRVEKIFGEDLLYSQIKEKLIGITIYYIPNLENVIEVIIEENIRNEKIKDYIKDNKHKLINLMKNKNHINIRTLKIALRIIEKILNVIFDMDLSKYEDRVINNCKMDILTYTMIACIEYKEGSWQKNDKPEFFNISTENDITEIHNGFKFVDDIIQKSYVDVERIKKVILSYMKSKTEDTNASDDPINILTYYWEMEDKEIEKNYELLREKLKKNLYKSTAYSKIMYIIMKLINIGFPEKYLEEIQNIMLENLKKSNIIEEYHAFDELDFAFNDEEERKKYEQIISPIKDVIDNANDNGRKVNINTIINGEKGWGEKFSNYCLENKGNFQSRKEYFKLIDVENLLNCIKKSNTKEISDFRRCVATIYNFRNIKDFYQNDLVNLETFLKGLESISETELECYDKSKKYNIEWLKRNFKDVVETLNK